MGRRFASPDLPTAQDQFHLQQFWKEESKVISKHDHKVLRLVSENNRCSGRVEIQYRDQWGTVCDIYFGFEDASMVCEHLQCGAVIATPGGAHFGEGTGPVWKENYKCRGNESRLWDCPVSSWEQFNCSHVNDASVICSDEGWPPRLTNGESRCDGRVEIYSNGSWGRVRDNLWDLNDANVVCRQLGCGYAISAYNSSKYGEGEGPVWVNDVQCKGNESQLQNCSSFTLNQSLTDSEDVGVLCSVFYRYVNSKRVVRGGLKPIRDHYAELLMETEGMAEVLNKYFASVFTKKVDAASVSLKEDIVVILDGVKIDKEELLGRLALLKVEHKEIRLVKGRHPCEGRVEVFYRGSWGTVCSDGWDMDDGEVVCKQLQCGSVAATPFNAHFGEGTGHIWLDNVECRSHESYLWQCISTPWDQHDCKHRKDAGVVCSVGGRTNCSGRVEIMFNNTWGTVCDDSWDRREAHVVCRQLDCGSALADSGEPVFGKGEGPVWLNRVQCKGSELFLWDCRSSTWSQRVCAHKVASVMCSDVLIPGVIISTPVAVSIILGTLLVSVLIALTVQQQRQSSRRVYRSNSGEIDLEYYTSTRLSQTDQNSQNPEDHTRERLSKQAYDDIDSGTLNDQTPSAEGPDGLKLLPVV
ncbi:scavenger receptor cysteine-rich type 1 protein M130-like [Heptranchias perlo]|uniref:scavenger receptor cysteine-rich type 1 protein M130-like n=1 Tax=Heptranchias perlo TaxID=212740 RepID=UPI00355A7349